MEGSYSHAKTIKMVLVRLQLYPTPACMGLKGFVVVVVCGSMMLDC
jgi:hypothetical protein